MRYIDFVNLKYRPKGTDLICDFYLEPLNQPLDVIAGGVAAESSVKSVSPVLLTYRPNVVPVGEAPKSTCSR